MANLKLAYPVAGSETVTAEIYSSDGSLIQAGIVMSDSIRPMMYLGNYAQLAAGQDIVYKDNGEVVGADTNLPSVTIEDKTGFEISGTKTKLDDLNDPTAAECKADLTTLEGRLTPERAGYLDNLDVSGKVASAGGLIAVNNYLSNISSVKLPAIEGKIDIIDESVDGIVDELDTTPLATLSTFTPSQPVILTAAYDAAKTAAQAGDQMVASNMITAEAIVDEFEAQSQADPTGFHVNVMEVGGVAQTANDNGAAINSILEDTAAIKGTTFDSTTDSLEAIRNRGDAEWNTADVSTIDSIVDDIKSYLIDGGRIDLLLDAIKANTDDLADGARLDLLIDAIKAKTANLNFIGTDVKATLDGEEVTTDSASRTASKADVSNLDVAVSTRLAATDYTAPNNADVTAIKAVTDVLNNLIDTVNNKFTSAALAEAPTAGMDETELHAALDSYANKANWKNDLDAATVVSTLLADTSILAGGVWTYAKILKVITALLAGKCQDKAGTAGTYQFLDADDDTTVIAELTLAEASPQRTVTIP